MFLYSKSQKYIASILYLTINALFYFKYLYRISLIASLLSLAVYLIFSYIVFDKFYKYKLAISGKLLIVLIVGYTVCCGIVLAFIPKESLNVDRWEMIQVFWDAVSQNIYPYSAQGINGNYPGPMPFYFILSYPFYLIGEIGYMAITGVLLWLYYIYKKERKALFLMVLLLFSSLAIYWEIFARSTIFLNSCLFAFFIFSLKDLNKKTNGEFYLLAIIGGLLTSTRTVFAIVLILWGIYVLIHERMNFWKLTKWGLCFIISFILSFIPFIMMDPEAFKEMNPFITQSSVLMPFWLVLCFIGFSVLLGFFCKRFIDVIYYGGILLFLTITGHFIYAISENGIDGYLNAGADISYYIFCFPFLLKVIAYTNDRR